jgi:protein tyrosine/serine phosphatase
MVDRSDPSAAGPRWLPLSGLANPRCLGGLPTVDGGRTRPGVLLRSDDPVGCTAEDVRHLVDELALSLVVDLRSPEEHADGGACPLEAAGVRRLRVSLLDRDAMATVFGGAPVSDADEDGARWVAESYLQVTASAGRALAGIVSEVASLDAGPALVHCAAGKDRTGVTVALLLAAAGVRPEAIVADYALTDERMVAVVEAMRGRAGVPFDDSPRPAILLRAPARTMELFLDGFARDHGDVGGWLRDHGVTAAELDRWRGRFVS